MRKSNNGENENAQLNSQKFDLARGQGTSVEVSREASTSSEYTRPAQSNRHIMHLLLHDCCELECCVIISDISRSWLTSRINNPANVISESTEGYLLIMQIVTCHDIIIMIISICLSYLFRILLGWRNLAGFLFWGLVNIPCWRIKVQKQTTNK